MLNTTHSLESKGKPTEEKYLLLAISLLIGDENGAATLESLDPFATVDMGRKIPHLTQEVTYIFSKKIVNS
jgi:hypothetical protein